MRKTLSFLALALLSSCFASAQARQTSVPLGDAIEKALAKASLAGPDVRPFHMKIIVSEPENPKSPYQGTIEEWWQSSDQWRREVTDLEGMRQTIVMAGGKKTEKDEGDYFPLWLRNFVSGAFDPVPNAAMWKSTGATINQMFLGSGMQSDACTRLKSHIGTGDRATDAYFVLCFDGEGRLKSVITPRYSMEFGDYRGWGKKQVPRELSDDPESGTHLVGKILQLEDLSKTANAALFSPLGSDDEKFRSAEASPSQLEQWTANDPAIIWPTVSSGKTSGHSAIYISIDAEGKVREAWPLYSDGDVGDSLREQVVRNWKIAPPKDPEGKPLQVDGGLGFSFQTAIGYPLPLLTDAEARALAIKIVEPVFPAGSVKSGVRYRISVSVNMDGNVIGIGGSATAIPGTEPLWGPALFPAIEALKKWQFRPLIRDGQPRDFGADLILIGK